MLQTESPTGMQRGFQEWMEKDSYGCSAVIWGSPKVTPQINFLAGSNLSPITILATPFVQDNLQDSIEVFLAWLDCLRMHVNQNAFKRIACDGLKLHVS